MKNLLLATVALPLMGLGALAFDLEKMSDAERNAFRAEIRNYLLENPEVIFEAVEIYQNREAAATEAATNEVLAAMQAANFEDGASYIGGNPEGDVTIVEYVDYRCGYCRRAHSELSDILKEDGNIRWIVKEYPILSEASAQSAQLAMSTLKNFGPEAYLAMHDQLMTYQGPLNTAGVQGLARKIGVDADILLAGIEDPAIEEYLFQVRAEAEQLQINGTPAFIIGDDVIRGYIEPRAMKAAVQAAREAKAD